MGRFGPKSVQTPLKPICRNSYGIVRELQAHVELELVQHVFFLLNQFRIIVKSTRTILDQQKSYNQWSIFLSEKLNNYFK